MSQSKLTVPDHTAVRVALWRAMHVLVDPPPHVVRDEIGLHLANPGPDWQKRPDMHPQGTRGYRASIIGRARLIEDLVLEEHSKGLNQYVILGAGLDTFAQRKPHSTAALRVFEVDKAETQDWKKARLMELGYNTANQHFIPVDFEAGESWREKLVAGGFILNQPAVITSTGVAMYLTREANAATLREIKLFAKGSVFAMTFMLPLDLIPAAERPQHEMVYERARAAGTPFISFFRPEEMLALAHECGFKQTKHISRGEIIAKYFADRPDGLEPSTGEEVLLVTV